MRRRSCASRRFILAGMSTMVEPRVTPLVPPQPSSPARRLPAIPVDHQILVEWEPQTKRFALALNARKKHIAHLTATEIHKAHGELRQVHPAVDELFPTKLAPRTCSEATSVCANLKRYLKGVLEGEFPVLLYFSASPLISSVARRLLCCHTKTSRCGIREAGLVLTDVKRGFLARPDFGTQI